jgi:hypothetical protein
MIKVSLDHASDPVREFVKSLPIEQGSVELELNGAVVCTVSPPTRMDRATLLERGREIVRRARERNRGKSEEEIEREVNDAVELVRQRHRQ